MSQQPEATEWEPVKQGDHITCRVAYDWGSLCNNPATWRRRLINGLSEDPILGPWEYACGLHKSRGESRPKLMPPLTGLKRDEHHELNFTISGPDAKKILDDAHLRAGQYFGDVDYSLWLNVRPLVHSNNGDVILYEAEVSATAT